MLKTTQVLDFLNREDSLSTMTLKVAWAEQLTGTAMKASPQFEAEALSFTLTYPLNSIHFYLLTS